MRRVALRGLSVGSLSCVGLLCGLTTPAHAGKPTRHKPLPRDAWATPPTPDLRWARWGLTAAAAKKRLTAEKIRFWTALKRVRTVRRVRGRRVWGARRERTLRWKTRPWKVKLLFLYRGRPWGLTQVHLDRMQKLSSVRTRSRLIRAVLRQLTARHGKPRSLKRTRNMPMPGQLEVLASWRLRTQDLHLQIIASAKDASVGLSRYRR